MADSRLGPGRVLKPIANVTALVLVLPAAAICWLEEALSPGAEGAFGFWAHVFALLPGHVGAFLRRAFYRLTLDACDVNVQIGFGTFFSHRHSVVESDVNIGAYAVIGSVVLRRGCLIGTRASLLSGSTQHTRGADGRWTSDGATFTSIEIGENVWIGEAATVMADIGANATVSAGSVVSTPTPAGVVVAGNPARFVRQIAPDRLSVVSREERPAKAADPGRLPALDWLKCLGMTLIVYGHVAAWTSAATLRPIYTKQLGVAFFVFATGYSLARESRPAWQALYNRLFELILFGVPIAVLLSVAAYEANGGLLLSNYAPFFFGANVVFDFFPANPTSWYVGTYIHLLLVWALLRRRVRVSGRLLIAVCFAEVAIRALLMATAGSFVAYMLLTNWTTVLLVGYICGQERSERRVKLQRAECAAGAALLVGGLAAWVAFGSRLPFEGSFPFMRLTLGSSIVSALMVSALITTTYVGVTRLLFACLEPLRVSRVVEFVARNTIVIFLAHMPIVFATTPVFDAMGMGRDVRAILQFLICLPGLAVVSEVLRKVVNPVKLRARLPLFRAAPVKLQQAV